MGVGEKQSVQPRDEFCPSFLCDLCYEYEKLWHKFYAYGMGMGLEELKLLSDKIKEQRTKIDKLRTQALKTY